MGGARLYNAGVAATSLQESAADGVAGRQGLYASDPCAWAAAQAAAMRRRDFDAIDWANVIEEIEDVARHEQREWVSRCRNVISHLLNIHHSPDSSDVDHWRKEIEDCRGDMHDLLADNPSMRSALPEMLAKAWKRGRAIAVRKLAEGGSSGNAAHEWRLRRGWESRLPRELPYALVDISGYDPFDPDAEPGAEVWPAEVAQALNDALGTDYPVRRRAPERAKGRSS